jgi:prolyl oligopeptidase
MYTNRTSNGRAGEYAFCLIAVLLGSPSNAAKVPDIPTLTYPTAPRSAQTDDYFGVQVADPYRPLEDMDDRRTRDWVEAQNKLSRGFLDSLPTRARIKQRLGELWREEQVDTVKKRGNRVFFERNDGIQNQSVLYVEEGSAVRVLLDPNAMSVDGTVAVTDYEPSPDGAWIAYAVSDAGSDWKTWHVREVASGRDLSDELHFTKLTGASWRNDSSGFYYSRYPSSPSGQGDESAQVSIQFHHINTAQSEDELVFRDVDHPSRNAYGTATDDGQYLVIRLFDGYSRNGFNILDLRSTSAKVQPLLDRWDALYDFIGSRADELYFKTTLGAPNGRVVAIDARNSQMSAWHDIIPQSRNPLKRVSLVGNRLIAQYLTDATFVVRTFDVHGRASRKLELPGSGTVTGFADQREGNETFFSYTDFLTPATVYRYDSASGTTTPFHAARQHFDAAPYITERIFLKSKDGTRVPMFLTHRRALKRDGNNPVLLYGYGGFAIGVTASYSPSVAMWLEMGGVYASANLRGGDEYGATWHEGGTRANKQNVFDDFIGAAQWLFDNHYTSPSRIVMRGVSNGGLLVGSVLTQQPNMFGAALPTVGIYDMLRYQIASANARQWSSEYGLSESKEQFDALYNYSPLHRVQPGTCYPPTLISAADHDNRAVPWHAYKFAAALQFAQSCGNPILLNVDTRAGHMDRPVWMEVEDFADQWAFAALALQMEWK